MFGLARCSSSVDEGVAKPLILRLCQNWPYASRLLRLGSKSAPAEPTLRTDANSAPLPIPVTQSSSQPQRLRRFIADDAVII